MSARRFTALVAPDAFKGSLRSDAVAAAMCDGLQRGGWPGVIDVCPVADGGDGSLTAIAAGGEGEIHQRTVRGPFGRPVVAEWWMGNDGTAVIELARASGLGLCSSTAILEASTFGTGQLIEAACEYGASQILLACGGSATVDGGVGLLAALGVRFLDVDGVIVDPRPRDLPRLLGIEVPPSLEVLPLTVLSDVRNPLLGVEGAATVFGPQKGVQPDEIEHLEACLTQLSSVISRSFSREVSTIEGGGAAGGVAAGLAGVLGCPLVSGFSEIARRVGLSTRMASADVVLTGEGQIDDQTWSGKTIAGIASMAAQSGTSVWAFGGRVASSALHGRPLGVNLIAVTPSGLPLTSALPRTAELVTEAVRRSVPEILARCQAGAPLAP